MAKGFFTQGLVVLLEEAVGIDEIKGLLTDFDIFKEVEAAEEWAYAGPSVVAKYRPEANGLVAVDVVDRAWPDKMGDPEKEATLFGAWSMGHFGPYAYPHGLERATEQAWQWEEAGETVEKHQAFVRFRLSYVFGAKKDEAPAAPKDCNPLHELRFLTRMVQAVLNHDSALCYFNPNGEVLTPGDKLTESIAFHDKHSLPPFDAWSNVRIYTLDEKWSFMDTVGNAQLDLPDQEVGFPSDSVKPHDVNNFMKNVSLHLLEGGQPFNDGDRTVGPGGSKWRVSLLEKGLTQPPRPVMRWLPREATDVPGVLLGESKED
jgi:hypothetical protein